MVKFKDIPCYCINLPEATERRKAVQLEFDRVGIKVEYFEGIKRADGYIGNTLSHLKALQKAVDNDLKYVCVFEDDVVFAEDFNERINDLPEFNLFYLGGHSNWAHSYTKTAYKNIYKCIELGGFHAIIYNRYAMEWLLTYFTDVTQSDAFMGHVATVELHAVCKLPFAVSCAQGYSYVNKNSCHVPNWDWQYEPKWDSNKEYEIQIKW